MSKLFRVTLVVIEDDGYDEADTIEDVTNALIGGDVLTVGEMEARPAKAVVEE